MNMTLMSHYANMLFDGDQTRVIYASTEYALRKRAEDNPNLDLPFMNFRIDDIQNKTDRPWWNHGLHIHGLYVPELQRKLRMNPITITYDATVFYHKYKDTLVGHTELLWDDSNETNLKATIQIDGQDVHYPGMLGYNLNFQPSYNENDWLERNKISTISVNFEIETFLILDNVNITIPDTVLFNFLVENQYDLTQIDDTYQAAIDHFNEEVGNFTAAP